MKQSIECFKQVLNTLRDYPPYIMSRDYFEWKFRHIGDKALEHLNLLDDVDCVVTDTECIRLTSKGYDLLRFLEYSDIRDNDFTLRELMNIIDKRHI